MADLNYARSLVAWKTLDSYITASEEQYQQNSFKRADTELRRAELDSFVKSILHSQSP